MKVLIPGHRYELENVEGSPAQVIQFIQKEPKKGPLGLYNKQVVTVCDGTTNEELMAVLIHRLKTVNERFPCRENAISITKLEEALMWQEKRTAERKARGVEGTHKL